MSEFQPINFFTNYSPQSFEDTPFLETSHAIISDDEQSEMQSQSGHSNSTGSFSSTKKTVSSENHNMVKQLIISMKQIMGKYINQIGSTQLVKSIIKQVWKVFTGLKNPTKDILRAMFDNEKDQRLMEKVGLEHITKKFDMSAYSQAMQELKSEILFRMRETCLMSHLCDRKIQKKERLGAYIQYFLVDELKAGKITKRFGFDASKRIQEILAMTKQQNQFIDYCLEKFEV